MIAQNVYDEMMIGYVYYSEEMKWYECVSDDVYLTNVVAWQWSLSFLRGFEKRMDCLEWKEIPGTVKMFHKTHIFDNRT